MLGYGGSLLHVWNLAGWIHRHSVTFVGFSRTFANMSTISKYFAPVPTSDNAACEGTGASKKRKRDALHIDQVTGSGTPASKPLVPDISETRTLPDLQEEWRVLYSQTLPSAARRKDPAQTKWWVSTRRVQEGDVRSKPSLS